jgi:transcriptional regulator with XRE-family HTH domain
MPKITVKVPLEVTGLPGRLRVAMKAVATASGLPKLTQEQLESLSGVAQSSISRLLNERRSAGGHIAHAVLIANALAVRPAWLIVGEEPMRAAGAVIPILPKIIDADAQRPANVRVRAEDNKKQTPRP